MITLFFIFNFLKINIITTINIIIIPKTTENGFILKSNLSIEFFEHL